MIEAVPETVEQERVALRSRPDRFRSLERDCFDVIIVGAGTGGLTAGALLTRFGKSVLVLDCHYVAGGNATVFRRRDYEFDIGIHYIGNCGSEGAVPRILRAAGVEGVIFREMDPDGFDTFVFPDFTFRVPKGFDAFRKRLVEHFPGEAKGIARYVDALQAVGSFQDLGGGLFKGLRAMWQARAVLRYANRSVASFLDSCTQDPHLRAVLTAHSGDYAEPPSRASLMVHAGVTAGYLAGAYYPEGGGQTISNHLADAIERQGGKILLRAPVMKILIEHGRAVGVEFDSHHLGRSRVRAPIVISNADLKRTFFDLIGAEFVKPKTVRRIQGYEMAPALGVVYLGIRRDLRGQGVPDTNFWIHPTYDLEPLYAEARGGRFHPRPVCFAFSSSLKDPGNRRAAPKGHSNLELVTVVPSQPEAWGTTAQEMADGTYEKNPIYLQTKQALAERLLVAAERVFPGLKRDVDYCEVSSPMTHTRFTGSTGGTSYGIALIPKQFLFHRPGPSTEIGGLYICGASSMAGHGIPGAMWSGVLAASRIVGNQVLEDVMRRVA
jgi:all-trans-retinol 13,14-reductase